MRALTNSVILHIDGKLYLIKAYAISKLRILLAELFVELFNGNDAHSKSPVGGIKR
jgi:hypothetical protein